MTPKIHVDMNWLSRVSGNLERFRKTSQRVWSCRCNICGDSQKRKRMTRLYFYVVKGALKYKCHNCGAQGSFYSYMKDNFPSEFETYKRETFEDFFKKPGERENVEALAGLNSNFVSSSKGSLGSIETALLIKSMTPILDLPVDHEARAYLIARKFDESAMERLFYTEDFRKVGLYVNKESGEKLLENERRIVIPFFDEEGLIKAIQGRSLDPKNTRMKYITIKVDPDGNKIYGLERLNYEKVIYEVEGPLDSLFVENCIACCDGKLGKTDTADVLIWDNQPRNKEIVNYMEQAINEGKKIVVWPVSPNQKVDINDMIKFGLSREQIMKIIRENTYSGAKAKLLLMKWRRV